MNLESLPNEAEMENSVLFDGNAAVSNVHNFKLIIVSKINNIRTYHQNCSLFSNDIRIRKMDKLYMHLFSMF